MQPATTNNVVPIAPRTNNQNSRMEFVYNGAVYRLRFSYSPDDRIVTRVTVEQKATKKTPDGKDIWTPKHFEQVFRKGRAAKTWVEREEERQRAMNKLLALDGIYGREFRALAWAAYWYRGKNTAPPSVGIFNG